MIGKNIKNCIEATKIVIETLEILQKLNTSRRPLIYPTSYHC